MRTLLAVICALVFGLFAGCTAPQPLATGKVDPAASKFQVDAQRTINEGRRILVNADAVIGDSAETGIWTADQSQKMLDRAKAARLKLDTIQKTLDSGDVQQALSDANITKTLVDALLKEAIAARDKAKPKTTFLERVADPFSPSPFAI